MEPGFATTITADYLERCSESLVESWIDWVRSRARPGPTTALPDSALRNHIPPILKSLARFVRNPIEFARQEVIQDLRLHVQIRRDQGYSLPEVLAEFEGLADLVTRGVHQLLEERGDELSTAEAVAAMSRVATGLRSITYIVMATFSKSTEDNEEAIAAGLEQFARAISHELRNLLNAIGLTTQTLKTCLEDDEQARPLLEAIATAVKRSDSLLGTIHVLAMAEGARASQRLLTLNHGIHRLVEEFGDQACANGVDVHIVDPLPDTRVEAVLLYVVLANALGNAIKYSDPDKSRRSVTISAEILKENHAAAFCEIRVGDNGLGIEEELLPQVFQKEFRAHPEHAHGTGLGLYLVQQAVTARGGDVKIESQEGVGTTLTARIRCQAGALTADQYRVEALAGDAIWKEIQSSPELPERGKDELP